MIVTVKLGASKALAKAQAEAYNHGKPLGQRIRAAHFALLDKLLYYYAQHHQRQMAYNHEATGLRTNNSQLAQAVGCSQRSIVNLRARLRAAGLIREEFRGSNTSYEVFFNPTILAVMSQEGHNLAGRPDPAFFSEPLQSLRHTVSGYRKQDTNKLIELSGAGFRESRANAGEMAPKDVDKPGIGVENPQNGSGQDTIPGTVTGYETTKAGPDTAPPVAAAPPEAPPATLAQVLAGIPAQLRPAFQMHVTAMWLAAQTGLYGDKWLNETQQEAGQALLAEYLAYGRPERWAAGANEVVERIMLVRRWIDRGLQKGIKRFVPLPMQYFDIRNEKGFRITKAWLKAHRASVAAIKDREMLTKAVNAYMKALNGQAACGVAEMYRIISQRLGKRNAQLMEDFNRAIVNIHDAQNQAAV